MDNNKEYTTKIKPSSDKLLQLQKGFTIAEIVIVLVILGILFSVIAGGLFKQGESAKAKVTALKMKQVQGYLDAYKLQNNSYPSTLSALYDCSAQGSTFCTEFASAEDLKDAWGTPLTLSGDGRTYILKSLGADKRDGGTSTDADITLKGP